MDDIGGRMDAPGQMGGSVGRMGTEREMKKCNHVDAIQGDV